MIAAVTRASDMTDLDSSGSINMSDREFMLLARFVLDECGITLNKSKKIMLGSRLLKRITALGLTGYRDYYDYIISDEGRSLELENMLNAVTTNKTDFFRESDHFDFLSGNSMNPDISDRLLKGSDKLKIWSAGCSTGEEPYTIAMVLSEHPKIHQGAGFSILGSDISTDVLRKAAKAIYPMDKIHQIPDIYRKKFILRGVGEREGYFRMDPSIREKVTLKKINLLDSDYGMRKEMDIIFCRNVVIYFNREMQISLFGKLYDSLAPGGYLFIGHSETLNGINRDFNYVAPGIFRKPGHS